MASTIPPFANPTPAANLPPAAPGSYENPWPPAALSIVFIPKNSRPISIRPKKKFNNLTTKFKAGPKPFTKIAPIDLKAPDNSVIVDIPLVPTNSSNPVCPANCPANVTASSCFDTILAAFSNCKPKALAAASFAITLSNSAKPISLSILCCSFCTPSRSPANDNS